MQVFDVYQRTFVMSLLSNAASKVKLSNADLEQQLCSMMSSYVKTPTDLPDKTKFHIKTPTDEMIATIGSWELDWFGVISDKPDQKAWAINAVSVTKIDNIQSTADKGSTLPAKTAYVVGVAATNSKSKYDWLHENFDVNHVVNFTTFKPGHSYKDKEVSNTSEPYISAGTATGLSNILTKLRSPQWATGSKGTSLVEYLSSLDGSDAMIIFAGHSLGSALAPSLAYYLKCFAPDRPLASFGDRIFTYPTAGATPGNKAFSEGYAKEFPPQTWVEGGKASAEPYQFVNARLWNKYDIVPHAWNSYGHVDFDDNEAPCLNQVPQIYGNTPSSKSFKTRSVYFMIHGLVHEMKAQAKRAKDMTYYPLPGVMLPGHKPGEAPPKTNKEFARYVNFSHKDAYTGSADGKTKGLILPHPI